MSQGKEQRELATDIPKVRVLKHQLDSAITSVKELESLFDDSTANELCVSMYNLLENCREQLRILERMYTHGALDLRPTALELALRHLEQSQSAQASPGGVHDCEE